MKCVDMFQKGKGSFRARDSTEFTHISQVLPADLEVKQVCNFIWYPFYVTSQAATKL